MEQKLYGILEEGEQLLWCGAPEQFEMMNATYKTVQLRKILLTAIGIIALSAWYISAAIANGVKVQPIAILVCALPFLYSIYNDFSDVKKLRSRTLYAMTDRRMITVIDNVVSHIDYEKIDDWKLEADADGMVSLICGSDAVKAKPHTRRAAAVCGAHTNIDTALCESYVMYGITADVKNIEKIISGRIGVEA